MDLHGEAVPGLGRRFTQVVTADAGVVLLGSEDWVVVRPGPAASVFRLVDGVRTADEIVRELEEQLDPAVVHYTLLVLERAGYLVHEENGEGAVQPGAQDRDGLARSSPLEALLTSAWRRAEADQEVVVVGSVELSAAGGPSVDMAVATDFLDERLDGPNREALASGHPLLLLRPSPTDAWLGPLIQPEETACWRCLVYRLRANRPGHLLREREGVSVRRASLRGGAGHQVSTTMVRTLGRRLVGLASGAGVRSLAGVLLRLDADTGGETRHPVSQRPQCPACGSPQATARICPVELRSREGVNVVGGGFRAVSADETYQRFRHLVSPLTGVVRHLNRVTAEGAPGEGDGLVHTYTAAHCSRLGTPTFRSLERERRDHSGGKGLTDMEARVSALCEALERYSAVFHGDEVRRLATFEELGEPAVHPNDCLHFSESQYAQRREWNQRCAGSFQWVPERFDPGARLWWSPLWSLSVREWRWLPTSYLYSGFDGPGKEFCKADSNGLAAGNHLEEAILQGLLELVERDAVALWWYNRTHHRKVDLESFHDPRVLPLLRYYRSLGRALWVLDITSDLGIPCFAAVSARTASPQDILMGFGAHLDPAVAFRRAITELNQALPTVLRSREERRRQLLPEFADAIEWWETATLSENPHLVPDPSGRAVARHEFQSRGPVDLRGEIEYCVDVCARAGLEVLVLDLTRPDVGVSVARVVVPGLRHFWRRLAPGRLYDVPVTLGRLPRALEEAELNPVPMFL